MRPGTDAIFGAAFLWIACLWAVIGGWLLGLFDVTWSNVTGLWMLVTFYWLMRSITSGKRNESGHQ